jgi:hypothetical protein
VTHIASETAWGTASFAFASDRDRHVNAADDISETSMKQNTVCWKMQEVVSPYPSVQEEHLPAITSVSLGII